MTKVREKYQAKCRKRGRGGFGHVLRREEDYTGKRAMAWEVQGTSRKRARPKQQRWMDNIKDDMKEDYAGKRAMALEVQGMRRKRGRPTLQRWMDETKDDAEDI